jgi:hypothetical protein
MKDAASLAGDRAHRDPAVGLHAVWALRTLLERVERLQVDNARTAGWSWADIARVLRVSKQSVHEKHAPRRKALEMEA